MKTWKQAPLNPELSQLVECYWLLEFNQTSRNQTAPILLPNPNAHLVITPASSAHHYQCQGDQTQATFTGPHLLMPSNHPLLLLDNQYVLRLGIKFRPGAPYQLWGLSGNETLNCRFSDLLSVHPQLDTTELTALLAFRDDPAETAKQLDNLIDSMGKHTTADHHFQLVQKALKMLELGYSSGIEDQLGCSRRTLERAFVKVTGLTVKQHEIMMRLDKLFTYLYQQHQQPGHLLNWADIASQFGFSDQPHLIRELKKTIGATPGNYLNARNLIIDIYGNFEAMPQ